MTNVGMVEFIRQVPIVETCDVLVVGGGPAGFAAAVASGRAGSRTVLVDQYGYLGGMATAGLVGPFMTSYSADGETQIVRGLFDELVRRMADLGGAIHPSQVRAATSYSSYITSGHDHVTPFDPEVLKLVTFAMTEEADVRLLLHTFFVAPIVDASRVAGAVFVNKSGLRAIAAHVVIDCTGDADVAAAAGCPTVKGRSKDGRMQPATMFFRVRNVNKSRSDAYMREHPDDAEFKSLVTKAIAAGDFPIPHNECSVYETPQADVWRVNITRLHGIDGTNVQDLTRAEILGRRQVLDVLRFLRKYVPGFEQAELLDTAAQVGIRETRHIVGEYTLTAEDLLSGRTFPDVIACYSYPIDIHDPEGTGTAFVPMAQGRMYQIPYRVLVPQKVDQLLVAGRSVSATHEAAGAIRVMPAAFAMGQAAGIAAALAAKEGVPPRALDWRVLQAALRAGGAYLGDDATL